MEQLLSKADRGKVMAFLTQYQKDKYVYAHLNCRGLGLWASVLRCVQHKACVLAVFPGGLSSRLAVGGGDVMAETKQPIKKITSCIRLRPSTP